MVFWPNVFGTVTNTGTETVDFSLQIDTTIIYGPDRVRYAQADDLLFGITVEGVAPGDTASGGVPDADEVAETGDGIGNYFATYVDGSTCVARTTPE